MLPIINQPIYIIDAIIVILTSFYIISLLISVAKQKDINHLEPLEERVNLLLPLGLVIALVALLQIFGNLYIAPTTIFNSDTGDPRILTVGVIQELLALFMFLMISICVILVWFVLKTILHKKRTG